MKAEILIWTAWLMLILVTSLIGDITILLASIRYKAIKLRKVLVVLIQHIAVSDLIISLTSIFPQTVSMAAQSAVFGENLKYLLAYAPYYGFLASKLLVLALIVMKWLIITYPLRCRSWSEKTAHSLCAGIWVTSLLCMGRFLVSPSDIGFQEQIYRYNYNYSDREVWSWLSPTYFALTTYLPNTVILAFTILLIRHLLKARRVTSRSGGSPRWQGLITVIVTAIVYSISYLPYAVYFAVKSHVSGVSELIFKRFAYTCGYFNVVCNFFIYSLTVKSFGSFLRAKVHSLTSCQGEFSPDSIYCLTNLIRLKK